VAALIRVAVATADRAPDWELTLGSPAEEADAAPARPVHTA